MIKNNAYKISTKFPHHNPYCITDRRTVKLENITRKNFSHSFSNGNEPGVKNMKAILGFFEGMDGSESRSLMTTREASSSSVRTLAASGGSQSLKGPQTLDEKK